MRRKIFKITVLCILILTLFSSCDYTKNEIKNRLIVQAIGVDATQNGVRLTLQTLNTDMAGNPNSGGNLGDVINSITVEGTTIADALSSLSKSIGKKPLLSQNRIIVFGRKIAEKGLYPYLDFFVRSTENRSTVLLALSDTTAEDVVSTKMGESILSANSLEEIHYAARFNSQIVRQELYAFVNRLEDPLSDAFLPIIKSENAGGKKAKEDEGEGKFTLHSVGVFREDKLSFDIRNEEVTALLLLNDQLEGGTFTVENTKRQSLSTAQIQQCKVRVYPCLENNKVDYNVKIKMTVDLLENQTKVPFLSDESYIAEQKALCEEKITSLVSENMEQIFLKRKSDPYHLLKRLSIYHPFFYKEKSVDELKEIPFTYSIKTDIKIAFIGNETENL